MQFNNLLTSYWGCLSKLIENDSSGSLKDDWLQANWELIVEGQLGDKSIVLEPYGNGADCNGLSSRVLYPDRQSTHKLICSVSSSQHVYDFLNGESLDITICDITFDHFVTIANDGWYYEVPPFDKILGEYKGAAVVVDFNNVDIILKPLPDN